MVVPKELFPGVQVNTDYFEEEHKVNELKNEVAELDIVLINEQLKEIEVWKLQSLSSLSCLWNYDSLEQNKIVAYTLI